MKKNILVLLLIMSFCFSYAQSYRTLPLHHGRWVSADVNTDPHFEEYYLYRSTETPLDTTINGLDYSKVYISQTSSTSLIRPEKYIGAYRSDTTGYTFMVPADSSQEYQVMDFTKHVNDTVKNVLFTDIYSNYQGKYYLHDLIIDGIDTITVGPYKLKRIVLFNPGNEFFWIEKIGCVPGGLVTWFYPSGTLQHLYCMSSTDTIFYGPNPNVSSPKYVIINGGGCASAYPLSTEEETTNTLQINLYPNPIVQSFKIELPQNISLSSGIHFSLIDIFGREVMNEKLYSHFSDFSRGNLNSGMYFWKVMDKEGTILGFGKLVFL